MSHLNESVEEILKKIEINQSSFSELYSYLKEIAGNEISVIVNTYFENRIKSILKASSSKELIELDETWRLLESIQVAICKFLYKENLILSEVVEDFAHDFDRIDDPETQAYIYRRLLNHELTYT